MNGNAYFHVPAIGAWLARQYIAERTGHRDVCPVLKKRYGFDMNFSPCSGEFRDGICRVCNIKMADHPIVIAKDHHLLKDGVGIPFIDYDRCGAEHIHIACPAVIYHEGEQK